LSALGVEPGADVSCDGGSAVGPPITASNGSDDSVLPVGTPAIRFEPDPDGVEGVVKDCAVGKTDEKLPPDEMPAPP
jgi:hypothetical protein